MIDTCLTNANLVMASEDLDWIVNLTHAMRTSTDTDEYYIKHPTGRKQLLEEEAFDTSDKGEVLKIMQHLAAHKAPAREHAMLRKGDKHTEDLAMQDFKEMRREMSSFNAQMMKVLEDKDGQEGFMADIHNWIRKNYGTDPNIFAGILAWRMIEDLDNMNIDELATIESNKLHNLIKDGPDPIRKSVDMFNRLASIDKSVAQLMQLGDDDKQIKRLATIPVMSIIEKKFTEQRWENFRAEVRKYREKDNDKEKFKWNSLYTNLKNIHVRNSGEDNLASVLSPEDTQPTGFRKMKGSKLGRNIEMPPGVSLAATSYQDFRIIEAGKTPSKYTGQRAAYSKTRGDAYTGDKDVPFGRPTMMDHKCICSVAECNWITYVWKRNPKEIDAGMSADDVFKIAKNCVKCNVPKPDQTKRHARAHVEDDGDEDNAESHDVVPEDELETAHWANDNDHGTIDTGTGKDFGLTAAPSVTGITCTTPASATVPYMCQVCSCPMSSISTNGPTCDDCAKHEIKWYPMRQASYSIAVMNKIKTIPLLYTIICIIQQLAEHVEVSYGDCKQWLMNMDGTHPPRLEFSGKRIAIMMIVTIVATTMGSAHGATHVQHCVNSTIRSSTIHYDGYRTKHSPIDAEGIAHRQRMKGELALISQGAVGQCYLDSGCFTTIINRRSILQNIRPLSHPVTIKGLAGNMQIKYQEDLRLPVQGSGGRPVLPEIQDVYYQPSSAYNVISCSQLEDARYDVMFQQRQIMGQDQAIGITRTVNIHAIQEADNDTKGYIFHQDTAYAGAHVGKMKADELLHRRLMHMSYGRLKRASTMNLSDMSSFKIHDYPCHTCMDANPKRANRKPVSGRDTCDA